MWLNIEIAIVLVLSGAGVSTECDGQAASGERVLVQIVSRL